MIVGYLDQPYTSGIKGYLDQPYVLTSFIDGHLDQPYGSEVTGYLNQPYRSAYYIFGYLEQYYVSAIEVFGNLNAPYSSGRLIQGYLDSMYDLAASLTGFIDAVYTLSNETIYGSFDALYDLLPIKRLTGFIDQPYSLMTDLATVVPVDVAMRINDVVMPFSAVSVKYSKNTFCKEFSVTLCDEASYNSITEFDKVAIDILGTTFTFFVETKHFSESQSNKTFQISGLSESALLDSPNSPDVIFPDEGLTGLASTIAIDLAGDFALAFNIIEWPLLQGTFIPNDMSPIQALIALGETVGAILQTSHDSSLYLEYKYPISPPNWAVPEYTIISELSLFSMSINHVPKSGYNVFNVSNMSGEDFSVGLNQEVVSDTKIEIKAEPRPWQGDFNLTHSGGDWVAQYSDGIRSEEIKDEIVEIIAGVGKLSYQPEAVTKTKWLVSDLGDPDIAESGDILTPITGESLLEVTYNTRFHKYTFVDPRQEKVQIIAKDNA